MLRGRIFKEICGCDFIPGTIAEIDEMVAKARPNSPLALKLREHKERDARFARQLIRVINTK